jgi:hypothetical protein
MNVNVNVNEGMYNLLISTFVDGELHNDPYLQVSIFYIIVYLTWPAQPM